jgi:glutathione S-transferase
MSFLASTVHPARRQGLERSQEVFTLADQRLGPKAWLLDTYSIADIHLFRLYWRFVRSVQPATEQFPHLSAHYDRMMARPAVRRTCEIEAAIGYELPP